MAEITTRIVRVVEVPRSLLGEFCKTPEAQQVGVYLLVGGNADAEVQQVYVGQTGALPGRLAQHNQNKEFWNKALVVVSLTNSLTQTHALYLEWLFIKAATEAARFSIENGNSGAKPYTPAPMEADCQEIYETAKTLVTTLGYPVFDPVAVVNAENKGEGEVFYCRRGGADGRGLYTEEGFVVLKGSIGRLENVPSIVGAAGERLRLRLLQEGVMTPQGDKVVFQRDHLFGSPSVAALALMGRTANGWFEWSDKDGRTLNELKRQPTA
ncbi:MAG: GIY-YIG nuclease family protein [Burkholderiales bacterium]